MDRGQVKLDGQSNRIGPFNVPGVLQEWFPTKR